MQRYTAFAVEAFKLCKISKLLLQFSKYPINIFI